MSTPSFPIVTENGVHIFAEDLLIAARERDVRHLEYRDGYGRQFYSREQNEWLRVPSREQNEWLVHQHLSGVPATKLCCKLDKSAESVRTQIKKIYEQAESAAGCGYRPVFNALIRAQSKNLKPLDRGEENRIG